MKYTANKILLIITRQIGDVLLATPLLHSLRKAYPQAQIDQGGDYSIGLKGNQGSLHEAVVNFFDTAQTNKYRHVQYTFAEDIDKGHGRLETQRYWILTTLPDVDKWKGLRKYQEGGAYLSNG